MGNIPWDGTGINCYGMGTGQINMSHGQPCVLLSCFNAQPDIFAVMNCCVVALSVCSADNLTWGADSLYSV